MEAPQLSSQQNWSAYYCPTYRKSTLNYTVHANTITLIPDNPLNTDGQTGNCEAQRSYMRKEGLCFVRGINFSFILFLQDTKKMKRVSPFCTGKKQTQPCAHGWQQISLNSLSLGSQISLAYHHPPASSSDKTEQPLSNFFSPPLSYCTSCSCVHVYCAQ